MNRLPDTNTSTLPSPLSQWLHLKPDELASRVFEDEYDLAIAIKQGFQARAQQGNYGVERFIFN